MFKLFMNVTSLTIVLVFHLIILSCANVQTIKHSKLKSSLPNSNGSQIEAKQDKNNEANIVKVAAKSEIDCSKYHNGNKQYYIQSANGGNKALQTKVGATGYGAPPKNYYPEGQRRLMTIRASKIDAYRALAEMVGGLHIWGGTAIGNMVVERDRYRTFIDTYVRGARVISVSPQKDGTFQTTVELDVNQHFLSQVMAFIDPAADHECNGKDEKGSYAYYGLNGVSPSFYYSE
jgi:hypothetical protein